MISRNGATLELNQGFVASFAAWRDILKLIELLAHTELQRIHREPQRSFRLVSVVLCGQKNTGWLPANYLVITHSLCAITLKDSKITECLLK